MYTSAISPPFLFQKPNLTDFDSVNNYDNKKFKNNGIEGEGHSGKHRDETSGSNINSIQSRLVEDVYKPGHQLNTNQSGTVDSKMAMQSRESSINQSAEIKIKTKEGDEIIINFNQSLASSRSAFQIEQGGGTITGYADSDSFESGFTVTIEGDLNEGEQKSLKNLLEKMNKVTNDFFKGDVKSAFKHAQKVGFDTTQIASFSMDLNREETVQAVVAYQQTAMPEQNINTDMLKQASDFLAEVKDFISDTHSILDSLAEPKQSFFDLFNMIGQLDNGVHDQNAENGGQQLLTDIINNISDGFF